MSVNQYVQHDWSPIAWAVLLALMATVVVVGMCLFLLKATRPQQDRHVADGGTRGGAGTAGSR